MWFTCGLKRQSPCLLASNSTVIVRERSTCVLRAARTAFSSRAVTMLMPVTSQILRYSGISAHPKPNISTLMMTSLRRIVLLSWLDAPAGSWLIVRSPSAAQHPAARNDAGKEHENDRRQYQRSATILAPL